MRLCAPHAQRPLFAHLSHSPECVTPPPTFLSSSSSAARQARARPQKNAAAPPSPWFLCASAPRHDFAPCRWSWSSPFPRRRTAGKSWAGHLVLGRAALLGRRCRLKAASSPIPGAAQPGRGARWRRRRSQRSAAATYARARCPSAGRGSQERRRSRLDTQQPQQPAACKLSSPFNYCSTDF